MWFKVGYVAATVSLAAIDGAFLGGIAAIITAIGGVILGVLAYRKGQQAGLTPVDAGWHAALETLQQENERLRRELDRERRRARRR